MRLKLTESVQALLRPAPTSERPTSTVYFSVRRIIDKAAIEKGPRRLRLLIEAESDLELALEAEGGDQATEMVKARLDFERGRIAYWHGNDTVAIEIFLRIKRFFITQQDDSMVRSINEFLLLLDHPHLWEETEPKDRARHLFDIMKNIDYSTESPVAVLLMELLYPLAELMETAINAQALEMAIESLHNLSNLQTSHILGHTFIVLESKAKPILCSRPSNLSLLPAIQGINRSSSRLRTSWELSLPIKEGLTKSKVDSFPSCEANSPKH